MKIFNKVLDREKYLSIQIERSRSKYKYCKVSFNHVMQYKNIIQKSQICINTIACMGSRNSREVDLFRIVFFQGLIRGLAKFFEIRRYGYSTLFPFLESIGRFSLECTDRLVMGVEVNPDAKRKDILTCSFDDLPDKFENFFDLIYSNSFDQSLYPEKTAAEWVRVLKPGGLIILGFSDTPPTLTDPVGNITIDDVMKLFPGDLLFYCKNNSNYNDAIIRINK